jgi:hypothetical protein
MRHIVINSIIFICILQIAPIHSQNNAPIYPENYSYCKKETRHPGRTYFHYFHQVMIISLKAPLILPFIFLYCFLNFVVRRIILLHIMNERLTGTMVGFEKVGKRRVSCLKYYLPGILR